MNNSVFGETQENLRNRVQIDLMTDAAVLRNRVAKPSFGRGIPITDCLTVVQCSTDTCIEQTNLCWVYSIGTFETSHV